MRDTFLRMVTDDEKNTLHLLLEDKESGYGAKIILLKDEGYSVPEIRKATNHHDSNIRKWMHRFNENGTDGIMSKIHNHKPIKMHPDVENKIVEIVSKNPRKDYGLPFSTWSLRVLAGYVSKEINLIDAISHTGIRNILLKNIISSGEIPKQP
jgi:transposase